MDYNILSLLLIAAAVDAGTLSSLECNNTVYLNGRYYVSEKLKSFSGVPADLAINFRSGHVYFTLVASDFKMSLYRLKDSYEMERIAVNNLGQSSAVDNYNNIVYLATDNGVYRYNENTGTAQLHAALGDDVMYLAVADRGQTLYTATWPQNRVRKLIGRKSETFKPIANGHGLTVDLDNNIYYEAVKTPYVLKNAQNISIKINGFKPDALVDFFVAKSGEVFAMDESSNLYKVDAGNAFATSLGSFGLEGVNTFGIDEHDNILVGVTGAIWKWTQHDTSPCK